MSAGLMMQAYYLTVNTNDSLHAVFFFFFLTFNFLPSFCISTTTTQPAKGTDRRSDPESTKCTQPTDKTDTTVPHVYGSLERQTGKPMMQSSLKHLPCRHKGRSRGKRVAFGPGVNSVPVMKKQPTFKSCLNGEGAADLHTAELAT